MWVILRLLTAAIVGIVKFLWRRTAIEKRESSGDITWVYSQARHKNRVIATTFGVPLSSIVVVSDVNIALDRSAPEVLQPAVQDKYTTVTRGRRGRKRTHYHVHLKLTPAEADRIPAVIEVSSGIYAGAAKGGRMSVTLRPGALGIPWVEDIRPGE
ncbi:MAG: hypothetical protein HY736_23050 [Verrucomicrobia bacterium]|nr:hypothetical protein [Verrucomicrobiota bacterium]